MESSGCVMSRLLWSVPPEIHFSESWFLGLPLCWLTAKERRTALLNGKPSLICSSNSPLIHPCWFSLPVFQPNVFSKLEQVKARNSSLPLLCTRCYIDTAKMIWEEKYLLCGRKGKESWLLLRPGSTPGTMSQALGLSLPHVSSRQSYEVCVLFHSLDKKTEAQRGHWFESSLGEYWSL